MLHRRYFYAGLLLTFGGLATLSCEKTPEKEPEKEITATSVKLSQDAAEMTIGETVQLLVSITPSEAKDRPVIWASSKKAVATVSETGLVTAVSEGKSTITATVDGLSSSCLVIVEKGVVPVASVTLNKESMSMIKGETATLKATVLPEDATNLSVNWSSSDETIAEVDLSGTVTAKNGGETTIVARAGSQSAECVVTVSVPVESLDLDPASIELKVGETATISALVLPEDATEKTVTWTSSDETVVTVSEGVLSAVTPGEATVTAQCGDVSASCKVTVRIAFSGLCLEAVHSGTITIDSSPMKLTIEYSKDGLHWNSETADYIYINLKEGECVYLRGNNKTYSQSFDENSYVTNIQGSAPFYAYGDMMSLIDAENFESGISLTEKKALSSIFANSTNLYSHPEKDLVLSARDLSDKCYAGMFYNCTNLTRGPVLPATAMAPYCYYEMFYGCTSLTNAPVLPATSLAEECYELMFRGCTALKIAPELPSEEPYYGCYAGMFWGCSSLVSAPVLPAARVAESAYASMFRDCTSLTSPPALPASELSDKCYINMFYGCTSLEMTPSLPAEKMKYQCYASMFRDCTGLKRCTTGWLPSKVLAEGCYQNMFRGCTSLETAPTLQATTLASDCYSHMFYGCSSLTTAPALPATTLASNCYSYMFYGCSSLTTAPALPALTLFQGCYMDMFRDCTSLMTAPELSSTKLAQECYTGMFWGCTSLRTAPSLPATTLQVNCYASMFRGCTSLTMAPVLKALDLVDYCYYRMFTECSNLNFIEAWFRTTPHPLYTQEWVNGVPVTGTFIKNGNATWPTVYSTYAIPSGWNVSVTYP